MRGQDRAGRAGRRARGPAARAQREAPRGLRRLGRRLRVGPRRRPRPHLNHGLLPADGRRPVPVWPGRGHQRALRRLRHGRLARAGAQPSVLSQLPGHRGGGPDSGRRRRGVLPRGLRGGGRPLHQRPRAQVRPRGDGLRGAGAASRQRRRAGRRRARAHQGARDGHPHHGGEGGAARRSRAQGGNGLDDHPQRGTPAAGPRARPLAARGHRRHRLLAHGALLRDGRGKRRHAGGRRRGGARDGAGARDGDARAHPRGRVPQPGLLRPARGDGGGAAARPGRRAL